MKAEFAAAHLRCPVCRAECSLVLHAERSDDREVREGTLRCRSCGSEFAVHRGVAHLLVNPPEHVTREAAGLGRFAEFMRADGWDRDTIRRLPKNDSGYWYVQETSMNQLLDMVDFQPGQSIVDVGSNTCWATNTFARRGLKAIALDIATAELQGLYTADYFIEDGTSYFERVLGSMNDMPLTSGSVDYVFCCEVLHHNDPQGLRRTFEEAYRILKPGGQLLVVNETIKTLKDRSGVHTEGVEQFEGYEHAHWALKYRLDAIRAGFRTRLIEPSYRPFFSDAPHQLPAGRPPWRTLASATLFALRSVSVARRAYLMWVNHIAGGVQFGMIAKKPAEADHPHALPAEVRGGESLAQRYSAT